MHDKYKYTDYHKVIQLFDVWYIFTWLIPCCDGCYDFRIKRCSVRLYSQCFVGGFMSYIYIYFHLFMHSGGQHKRYLIRSRNCLSYTGIWDHPPFFFRLYSVLSKLLIVSLDYPFCIALSLCSMVLFCHYHLIKTYYRVNTKMSNEDYSFLTRVSYLNNYWTQCFYK
jgi:hypothetical protein